MKKIPKTFGKGRKKYRVSHKDKVLGTVKGNSPKDVVDTVTKYRPDLRGKTIDIVSAGAVRKRRVPKKKTK